MRVVAAATIWHAPAGQATIACTLELREKGQILCGEVGVWRRWRSQLLLLPWRLQSQLVRLHRLAELSMLVANPFLWALTTDNEDAIRYGIFNGQARVV